MAGVHLTEKNAPRDQSGLKKRSQRTPPGRQLVFVRIEMSTAASSLIAITISASASGVSSSSWSSSATNSPGGERQRVRWRLAKMWPLGSTSMDLDPRIALILRQTGARAGVSGGIVRNTELPVRIDLLANRVDGLSEPSRIGVEHRHHDTDARLQRQPAHHRRFNAPSTAASGVWVSTSAGTTVPSVRDSFSPIQSEDRPTIPRWPTCSRSTPRHFHEPAILLDLWIGPH